MDTWTTREGQTLALADMSDTHLLNAQRYVMRQALVAYGAKGARQLDRRAGQLIGLTNELKRRGLAYDEAGYKAVIAYDEELNPDPHDDWGWGDALTWIDFD